MRKQHAACMIIILSKKNYTFYTRTKLKGLKTTSIKYQKEKKNRQLSIATVDKERANTKFKKNSIKRNKNLNKKMRKKIRRAEHYKKPFFQDDQGCVYYEHNISTGQAKNNPVPDVILIADTFEAAARRKKY